MSKQYGLIIPGKSAMVVQAPGKRAAIFDEDSDSDEATSTKLSFLKPLEKKHTKIAQSKAIEEDPTVYQYDEVYDDMEKKRIDSKLSRKDLEKKPKYISNLLRAAERRKRENERRIERQVQREREAEGDEFKDKESFVTPSYQKKLEEMKALEEQEQREEYLESIGDVQKQGNIDGFYRHLYDQKVNYEDKIKIENDIKGKEIKEEPEENVKVKKRKSTTEEEKSDEDGKRKKGKKRQYRAREESNSEEEVVEVKKEHIPSNLDADSDFSIDSSDSDDEESSKKKEENIKSEENVHDEKIDANEKTPSVKPDNTEEVDSTEEKLVDAQKLVEKKPKIDIWKKRTVGEVFVAARTRYFERRALRESG